MSNKRNHLTAALVALSMLTTPVLQSISSMPVFADDAVTYAEGGTPTEPGKTETTDGTSKQTITNPSERAYKAYQIFKAKNANDGKLGNLEWNDKFNHATVISQLEINDAFKVGEENIFTGCETAEQFATILSTKLPADKATQQAFIRVLEANLPGNPTDIPAKSNSVNLAPGYYLLVDQTTVNAGADNYVAASILRVADGSITIQEKNDKPSVDKQVWDDDAHDVKGQEAAVTTPGFGESADHAIGEIFKFKLVATVPADTISSYKSYKMIFHDSYSAGIDYKGNIKIKITADGAVPIDVTDKIAPDTGATEDKPIVVEHNQTTRDLTVTIPDVKKFYSGSAKFEVEVVYDAALNTKAFSWNSGNENIATDQNNLNKVNLEYSNNPNLIGEGKPDTGKTTDDYVFVFTYKSENTKVDASNKDTKLEGAEFKLYKDSVDQKDENVIKLIWDQDLSAYRTPLETDNKNDIKDTIITKSEGKLNIVGLDAGIYILHETKAPDGYSLATDTEIIINPEHKENNDGTTTSLVFNKDDESKENTIGTNTIEDVPGGQLPETGGMGTTLFVTGGGVMLGAAALGLLAGKRKKNA